MKINNCELPDSLKKYLTSNVLPLADEQKIKLTTLLIGTETAIPELFTMDAICEANLFWTSVHVEDYLGYESDKHQPGKIDPLKTIIIGQAEPDSPIALDYRTNPPCVVYFADEGCWVELCPSYEALISMISNG